MKAGAWWRLVAMVVMVLAAADPSWADRRKIASLATVHERSDNELEPGRPLLDWELQLLVASRLGTEHDMILVFAHFNGNRLSSLFDATAQDKYDAYAFPNAVTIGLPNNPELGTDILWARLLRHGLPLSDVLDITALHQGHDRLVGANDLGGKLVGGSSSTHVLIWAPFPRYDNVEIDAIMQQFSGREGVTVHLAAGDGEHLVVAGENTYAADYPATAVGLNAALIDISAFLGPGEQFIFYATGPGTSLELEELPQKRTLGPGESARFAFSFAREEVRAWRRGSLEGLAVAGFETGFMNLFSPVTITVAGQSVDTTVEPHVYASQDLSIEMFELPLAVLDGLVPDADGAVTAELVLTNASSGDLEVGGLLLGPADQEVAAGPVRTLAAAARAQGAGAFFLTRWNLFNRGDVPLSAELSFIPRGGSAADAITATVDLAGHQLVEVEDPLSAVFGVADDTIGSVLVNVGGGAVPDLEMQSVITARLDDGSEYNQFFQTIPYARRLVPGVVAAFPTTEAPERNRVNLGACAIDDGTVLRIWPEKPLGTALAPSREMHLDRGGSEQLNNVHALFGLGLEPDVSLRLEVESGSAVGYVSVLDGVGGSYPGTSDPTTLLPLLDGSDAVTLLEVGPVQGLNEFAGSGSLTNHGTDAVTVSAEFYRRDHSGAEATAQVDLGAGETRGYGDLVASLFGLENAIGTVVVRGPEGSSLSAIGREYAVFRSGDAVVGTAGQPMPGLTDDDLLAAGWPHGFMGLRHTPAGERSHVAFFNPGDAPLSYTVELFDGAGSSEGTASGSVAGQSLVQVNNIIPRIQPQADSGVRRIEVSLDRPAHVLVFRVNPSGDPITIRPF